MIDTLAGIVDEAVNEAITIFLKENENEDSTVVINWNGRRNADRPGQPQAIPGAAEAYGPYYHRN